MSHVRCTQALIVSAAYTASARQRLTNQTITRGLVAIPQSLEKRRSRETVLRGKPAWNPDHERWSCIALLTHLDKTREEADEDWDYRPSPTEDFARAGGRPPPILAKGSGLKTHGDSATRIPTCMAHYTHSDFTQGNLPQLYKWQICHVMPTCMVHGLLQSRGKR